jgi:acyl carrier protein
MDTVTRIERIFREALSIEVPSPTTDIIDAGLLDSLALVTLLFEIEQQFAITIPLDELDIEGLRTVERIAALIESLATEADLGPTMEGGLRP